jgi:hypothetical protein
MESCNDDGNDRPPLAGEERSHSNEPNEASSVEADNAAGAAECTRAVETKTDYGDAKALPGPWSAKRENSGSRDNSGDDSVAPVQAPEASLPETDKYPDEANSGDDPEELL